MVGVGPNQARHVERGRQAFLAMVEQVSEALVGLLGRPEAGELAHRPQPAAVHRRVHAARVGVLARKADAGVRVRGQVLLGVQRLDRLAADGGEQPLPLPRAAQALALPALQRGQLTGLGGHGPKSTRGPWRDRPRVAQRARVRDAPTPGGPWHYGGRSVLGSPFSALIWVPRTSRRGPT